jgi:hypothetical protein
MTFTDLIKKNLTEKSTENFEVCPYNSGILVGNYATIKNKATGEVLEQTLSEWGYWEVKNPLKTSIITWEYELVHRLVALTYVDGYSRFSCCICHHIDKNPLNNLPENLIWTSKETHNKIHRYIPIEYVA